MRRGRPERQPALPSGLGGVRGWLQRVGRGLRPLDQARAARRVREPRLNRRVERVRWGDGTRAGARIHEVEAERVVRDHPGREHLGRARPARQRGRGRCPRWGWRLAPRWQRQLGVRRVGVLRAHATGEGVERRVQHVEPARVRRGVRHPRGIAGDGRRPTGRQQRLRRWLDPEPGRRRLDAQGRRVSVGFLADARDPLQEVLGGVEVDEAPLPPGNGRHRRAVAGLELLGELALVGVGKRPGLRGLGVGDRLGGGGPAASQRAGGGVHPQAERGAEHRTHPDAGPDLADRRPATFLGQRPHPGTGTREHPALDAVDSRAQRPAGLGEQAHRLRGPECALADHRRDAVALALAGHLDLVRLPQPLAACTRRGTRRPARRAGQRAPADPDADQRGPDAQARRGPRRRLHHPLLRGDNRRVERGNLLLAQAGRGRGGLRGGRPGLARDP